MSALNGDKARFQLRRRAGLKRREHSRLAAATLRLHAAGVVASVPGAESGRGDGGRLHPSDGGRRLYDQVCEPLNSAARVGGADGHRVGRLRAARIVRRHVHAARSHRPAGPADRIGRVGERTGHRRRSETRARRPPWPRPQPRGASDRGPVARRQSPRRESASRRPATRSAGSREPASQRGGPDGGLLASRRRCFGTPQRPSSSSKVALRLRGTECHAAPARQPVEPARQHRQARGEPVEPLPRVAAPEPDGARRPDAARVGGDAARREHRGSALRRDAASRSGRHHGVHLPGAARLRNRGAVSPAWASRSSWGASTRRCASTRRRGTWIRSSPGRPTPSGRRCSRTRPRAA